MVGKKLLEKAGRYRESFDGAQDYDFILRCSELAGEIGHIPQVLYHWRAIRHLRQVIRTVKVMPMRQAEKRWKNILKEPVRMPALNVWIIRDFTGLNIP